MFKKIILSSLLGLASFSAVCSTDSYLHIPELESPSVIVRPSNIAPELINDELEAVIKEQQEQASTQAELEITPFIFEGSEVENDNDFKFYAHVLKTYEGYDDYYYHNCGASILSDRYILTAAHCVMDSDRHSPNVGNIYDESELKVLVKNFNYNDFHSQELKAVKVIHSHSGFDPLNYFANDIAVLELVEPITDNVQSITLPTDSDKVKYESEIAWHLVGMGYTNNSNDRPDYLKYAQVLAKDDDTCDLESGIFDRTNVCASYDASLENAGLSCSGDSGGPLSWFDTTTETYKQLGLVSYGYGGCNNVGNAVFTELYNHIGFIQSSMTTSSNAMTFDPSIIEDTFRSEGDVHYIPSEEPDTPSDNGGGDSGGGSTGLLTLLGLGLLAIRKKR
jgi:secreted trypsin-like serine protease